MRVLVITPWYPSGPGDPTGSFVRDHALAAARDHEVVVVHLAHHGGEPRWVEFEDGPLRVLRRAPGPVVGKAGVAAFAFSAVGSALRRLRAEGFRPDVLHAHVFHVGLVAVVAGRVLRLPVVVSEHYSGFARGDVRGVSVGVARLAFAGADVVCPVSASLEATLRARGYRGTFQVVPNPLDTALFRLPSGPRAPGPPRVLYVGNLVPVKGPLTLVGAAASLPGVQVEIVGDGPLRGACLARVRDLGLESRVTLPGALPREQVAARMRSADVLAVPSEWETFSLVTSEALACGVPVVASSVGALVERVSAERGVLVEPGDPAALAAGLRAVLDRPQDYDRAALAAEAAASFSPERIAAVWDELYRRLVTARRRGGRP